MRFTKLIKLFPILLSLLFLNFRIQPALADIIVDVSGNGGNTQNTVTVSSSQTTEANQTNTAQAENNVSQDAISGDNTASNNSGATQISTGNVSEQTSVKNELNSSTVINNKCCQQDIEVSIIGNGVKSENQVEVNSKTNVSIDINSNARIENNLAFNGSSGHNTVGDNGGDVIVNTGNINVEGNVTNSVNTSQVKTGVGEGDIIIFNKNNDADSLNNIKIIVDDEFNFIREQNADIYNNFIAHLQTGGNEAENNLGNVFIGTGSTQLSFNLINAPVNEENAEILCCDNSTPINPPDGDGDGDSNTNPSAPPPGTGGTTVTTSNSSSGGSSSSSSDSGNGGQLLASLAQILPATGASAFRFWIYSVVYLLIFLSGLYLRLRAGRSPDYSRIYVYPY